MNSPQERQVNRLITAVIQEQDVESALQELTKYQLSITRLPSMGGYLSRRNATLLIGLNVNQIEPVVGILRQTCHTRVEYVTIPLEGSPMHLPAPTPISVGGATVFAFEVDYFEEF